MPKLDLGLPSYDSLFSTEEERQEASAEKVTTIPIDKITDFKGHPFHVTMDEDMAKLIDSIKENLSEDVGEAAENFEVSVEQELELARMIDETVKAWIEQEEIEPSCYCVLDGHIVSLN